MTDAAAFAVMFASASTVVCAASWIIGAVRSLSPV